MTSTTANATKNGDNFLEAFLLIFLRFDVVALEVVKGKSVRAEIIVRRSSSLSVKLISTIVQPSSEIIDETSDCSPTIRFLG